MLCILFVCIYTYIYYKFIKLCIIYIHTHKTHRVLKFQHLMYMDVLKCTSCQKGILGMTWRACCIKAIHTFTIIVICLDLSTLCTS